jgi:hypothetical protein
MEIKEQDSAGADGSYQCNFVLLSRKDKIKGLGDVSGQEFTEGSSSAENKVQN